MEHNSGFQAMLGKPSLRTKFLKFFCLLSGQRCLGLGADPVSRPPMPRLVAVMLVTPFHSAAALGRARR